MRAYIGLTDWKWFQYLRTLDNLEEVNFWQPSGARQFRALEPGELFLFKLHSPRNFIVGGGTFSLSSLIPISLAWDTFREGNGAPSLQELRSRIAEYRHEPGSRVENYTIGCILLLDPFFLDERDWIPVPSDWKPNLVQGRRYDLTTGPGAALWERLEALLRAREIRADAVAAEPDARYGSPVLRRSRLGQKSFRIAVTDAYDRRCSVTGERTLPALDAAHIVPYEADGPHRVNNGLLLRRDLHALFDTGYLTITPDHRIEVSDRIKQEFENGRDYYRLRGERLRPTRRRQDAPDSNALQWHNLHVFKG